MFKFIRNKIKLPGVCPFKDKNPETYENQILVGCVVRIPTK